MKTNTRFAVLDFKAKRVYIYEERRLIVTYQIDGPLTPEDIEEARTTPETTKA
jgi:hypothetical protein